MAKRRPRPDDARLRPRLRAAPHQTIGHDKEIIGGLKDGGIIVLDIIRTGMNTVDMMCMFLQGSEVRVGNDRTTMAGGVQEDMTIGDETVRRHGGIPMFQEAGMTMDATSGDVESILPIHLNTEEGGGIIHLLEGTTTLLVATGLRIVDRIHTIPETTLARFIDYRGDHLHLENATTCIGPERRSSDDGHL